MTGQGNIWRLSIAQALAGANSVTIYATAALVGDVLAPNKALATLPVSVFVVGMALGTIPVGVLSHRYGRRAAFMFGAGCGIAVGLLAALAIVTGSFALFCAAMPFGGVYAAVVLSFRFAAADAVPPDQRAPALSMVMAAGVFAGVIGPQMVTYTMNLWPPYLFAVSYLAQAGVALVNAGILMGVRMPRPSKGAAEGRPLSVIVRQPKFVAALGCGVISYMMMNLLMTSAPLAMRMCGLPLHDSNLGLQWHVVAMYGPSFFTGRLISRYGAARIAALGMALIAVAAAVGLSGRVTESFWACLVLLGVGWNFGFVGASSLVLECHRTEEKARVQSLNDFVVFGTMVLSSFASGGLLADFGWDAVCWVALPFVGLSMVILAAAAAMRGKPDGVLPGGA